MKQDTVIDAEWSEYVRPPLTMKTAAIELQQVVRQLERHTIVNEPLPTDLWVRLKDVRDFLIKETA